MNRNLLITITLGALLLTPAAWAFTEGDSNNFFGTNAGLSTTTGSSNTFMGGDAGRSNTSGFGSTFMGTSAGRSNTSGFGNTFIGRSTGHFNTTGDGNTFSGFNTGFNNTTGVNNTFSGFQAGFSNTAGIQNTFSGYRAGDSNTTGNSNTFSGHLAGFSNTTGNDNVFIGVLSGFFELGSNKLYIDNSGSITPLIYGEFDNNIVGINGTLGIGTQLPTSTLHVRRLDGTASILVEEMNPTTAPRTLLQLNNAGNTKFNLNNTDAGVEWAFTNSGNDFRISRQGSGAVEFLMDNSGNLTIQGALTELSSRESKHRITSLNPEQILNRVLALPIKEWSYKDSLTGIRHVGPMAEDFHQAFGLGENASGIATLDTSGIALVAIQGLKAEQDKLLTKQAKELAKQEQKLVALKAEKDAQIATLQKEKDAENLALQQQLRARDTEITALQTKLAQLTQMVQQLAAKDQRASAD